MFDFNPFEPGNFSTIGCWENDQEQKVNQLVSDYQNKIVGSYILTREMNSRGIDYFNLPQYLKDRIDMIEVY